MNKEDLKVDDIVTAAGYSNPQRIIALKDRYAVFLDMDNNIQGTQSYENIFDVVKKPKDKATRGDAFGIQIAGNHYSKLKIQPMEYALANNLNLAQGNVVKYVTRYKDKNGKQDLEKAIHCLQLLMEYEYGN